jgi:hypothetical protein
MISRIRVFLLGIDASSKLGGLQAGVKLSDMKASGGPTFQAAASILPT